MNDNLGDRLERMLKERKMSQKELAQRADITEAAVSHYIKGDRGPRSTTLGLIAGALGVTAGFLLGAGITSATAEKRKQTFEEARDMLERNSGYKKLEFVFFKFISRFCINKPRLYGESVRLDSYTV